MGIQSSRNIIFHELNVVLEEALLETQTLLREFSKQEDIAKKISFAFGKTVDIVAAQYWIEELSRADGSALPELDIRSASDINNANGAFAGEISKIFLAKEFLEENIYSRKAIVNVLLEEIGHAIDWQINPLDTPGDEGELFAALVQGVALEEAELQRLKAEDDSVLVAIDGQKLQIEQATTSQITVLQPTVLFPNLFNPVGIYTDANRNIFLNHSPGVSLFPGIFLNQSVIAKFSPDSQPLKSVNAPTSMDNIYLAPDPASGKIWGLTDYGQLMLIDPNTLNITRFLNVKNIPVDISSIYDIHTGTVDSFGGLLQPQFSSYGDIAVRQNGNVTELFITGRSQTQPFPFVMGIRLQGNTFLEAKVLASSKAEADQKVTPPPNFKTDEQGRTYGYDGRTVRLSPGIAVNQLGTVLTTLPFAQPSPSGNRTLIEVPVALRSDFNPTDGIQAGEAPRVVLNGIDLHSQGMTADAAGNFYIVTNSVGSRELRAGEGILVTIPSTLNTVTGVGSIGQSLSSFRDVAVNPARSEAYVTVSTYTVGAPGTFPADDLVVTFPVSGLGGVPGGTPGNDTVNPSGHDFNGDGVPDIILRNLPQTLNNSSSAAGTQGFIYLNSDGTVKGVQAILDKKNNQPYVQNSKTKDQTKYQWEIIDLGDFNGDKKTDLLWNAFKYNEPKRFNDGVWFLDGSQSELFDDTKIAEGKGEKYGFLVQQNEPDGIASNPIDWQVVGVADLNQDGKDDVAWYNDYTSPTNSNAQDQYNGQVAYWVMDGMNFTGTIPFIKDATGTQNAIQTNQNAKLVAVENFDNNSRPDFAWYDPITGEVSFWFTDELTGGGLKLKNATEPKLTQNLPTNLNIIGGVDVNLDGNTDLIAFSNTQLLIWTLDGNAGGTMDLLGNPITTDLTALNLNADWQAVA
jgi:hypothetical protein